jgi:hypothetical protein
MDKIFRMTQRSGTKAIIQEGSTRKSQTQVRDG